MKYMDYEKISDVIMNMSFNTILKMNVTLARKDKLKKRVHYYKEFSYKSNKYIDTNVLCNINRNFDYYLSIEKYADEKEFLMIRDENMLEMRFVLNQIVMRWITDDNIFALNNENKLIVLQGTWNPVVCNIAMNKVLRFEPIVIHNIDDTYGKGVRMYLNSDYSFIDLSINKISAFIYNINSLSLFQCAQNMLNFLQRPELGTNQTQYSYKSEFENITEDVSGGTDSINNSVGNALLKKKKDVFGQIDNM